MRGARPWRPSTRKKGVCRDSSESINATILLVEQAYDSSSYQYYYQSQSQPSFVQSGTRKESVNLSWLPLVVSLRETVIQVVSVTLLARAS
jgi:hypothetical protein